MKTLLFISLFFTNFTFAADLIVCAKGESEYNARSALISKISDYNSEDIMKANMTYPDEKTVYSLANGDFMACGEVKTTIKKVTCSVRPVVSSGFFSSSYYEITRTGASYSYKAESDVELAIIKNLIGCQVMK